MPELRAFSYGGGVQSTAALVLAAEGRIDFPLFLFANVGEDSENPATLEYVETHARPFAMLHDIELQTLRKRRSAKDDTPETLMQALDRTPNASIIPLHLDGAMHHRICTMDFKVRVLARELKRRGATKANPATLGLGISLDEFHRMRSKSEVPHEVLSYPLVDLKMTRQDCMNVIASGGLPVPPKSSCFFCPFHSINQWRTLLREEPELFAKAVKLEAEINRRRAANGKDGAWLTRKMIPLELAVTENGQLDMFDASCDIGGYCHA